MRTAGRTWVFALLVAAACGEGEADRPGPDTLVAQAFGGVPLFPGAGIGDLSGEGEAARATLHIRRPPDSVATWYRRSLITRRWYIVSDVTGADSVTTIHATSDGRPIWLMFRRDPASGGTLVTVIGAIPRAERDSN